ncbi:acyl-CoA dehydrogenase family protein [Streptomyces sp. enrichment culture]|uniref:acyl-CoA dehydrogenase family protein n=1 Tax=Streptomyces sp. enrichment culture TaxID=1795815 RepID=UPI003F54E62F
MRPTAQIPSAGTGGIQDAAARAARHARESEQSRTLHPAVADALLLAGFARHFVPAEFGGAVGTFAEILDSVARVGEGCTSAAWCAALQAAHGRLAAHLPGQGQADLWAEGPDTPVAAAVVPPAGELTTARGGYRLTGRWGFASGVDHAHWILLAAPEVGATGHQQRILAVPRADFSIHDTWHNSGLRGTGSHSVTVDDAFVPEHRTVLRDALAAGRTGEGVARCHRIPYTLVASLIFAAPALGAARGALRAWTALAADRVTAGGGRRLDDALAQQVLARSAAEVDAAHLLLRRAADRADQAPLDDLPVALNMRDASVAVEMLVGAVERLFRNGGTRAQADGEPLQRFWRDVHALAAHGALQLPPAAAAYGQFVAARGTTG